MGDPRDRIGSIVARSYRLERVLGEGGMGTVYEATHTRVPRKFAVKVLKPECASDRDLFERFRREAEIASSIGHEPASRTSTHRTRAAAEPNVPGATGAYPM